MSTIVDKPPLVVVDDRHGQRQPETVADRRGDHDDGNGRLQPDAYKCRLCAMDTMAMLESVTSAADVEGNTGTGTSILPAKDGGRKWVMFDYLAVVLFVLTCLNLMREG